MRFQADQPNQRWQTDITHWAPAGGADIEILNIIDDHSRLCVASVARHIFKAPDVDGVFRHAAATHGDPASVLSDNGAVFTGRYRGGGRVVLEVTLARPRHRLHPLPPLPPPNLREGRTLPPNPQKMASGQRPARSPRQLQTQLDAFATTYYNTIRPHRALGRHTPAEAYTARPKATPTGIPFDTAHYRVRHDTVDRNGKLTLRHNSRLHHIGIGRRHAGRPVLILIKDLHVRITTTDGQLLRDLHLDPTRDYQPQPKP